MKQLSLTIILLGTLISTLGYGLEQKTVRVLTFNILGGRNVDGKRDVKRIADVITTLKPDIVALQEVDKGTKRIQGRDTTKELATLTGMHSAYGKAMDFQGGEYGEAILSKYPIKVIKNYSLPAEKGAEPRAALTIVTTLPGTNQDYLFMATHLDHLSHGKNRLMQAEKINQLLNTIEMPYIFAGDLNAVPNSKTMILLAKEIQFVPEKYHTPTHSAKDPKTKIDWIGTDRSMKWTLVKSLTADKLETAPEGWLELLKVTSDHLPVLNIYSFKN